MASPGWLRPTWISRARTYGLNARALCVLAAVGSCLALAPTAGASTLRSGSSAKTAASARADRRHHDPRRLDPIRPRSHRARAAIVGGSPISIEQAPWQVAIIAEISKTELILCGGSILDATHILTAAHCTFNASATPIPPGNMHVVAGESKIAFKPGEGRLVKSVRIHPYYEPGAGFADDVAVLELELAGKLEFTKTIEPIALVEAGVTLPEGTPVNLTGFGDQSEIVGEKKVDGNLYSLGMTLGYSRECGGPADALLVCASTRTGTACHGDSGSGLTRAASLLGVTDFGLVVGEQYCPAGTLDGFANLAAPEIRDFVEGNEEPPRAPRGGGAVIHGVTIVGYSLGCEPGSWSNGPTFTYTFIDSATGQPLQAGASAVYPLAAADVGRRILCQVQAGNAGGTGVGRTPALAPIQAAPVAPPPPPKITPPVTATEPSSLSVIGASIPVLSNGAALVKLRCLGRTTCRGKLNLTSKRTVRIRGRKTTLAVSLGSVSFSIAEDTTVRLTIRLGPLGRRLLAAAHGRLGARLAVIRLEPAPVNRQVVAVELIQQKGHSRRT
jgi:Trypsin